MILYVHVSRSAARRFFQCAAPVMLLLSVSATPSSLAAQAPANRFFLSAGGGFGKSGPAQSLGQDQFSGPTIDVAAGVTMTSRGIIALHASGWQKDTPIGHSRSLFVTLSLMGYPFGSVLDNLYFQGGLGVGHGDLPVHTTTGTAVTRMNATHPALLVGAGYDIPIACPVWIAPFFQSYGTFGGKRIVNDPTTKLHESANVVLFHVGMSLKFAHPGPAGQCRQRGPSLTDQR
jgi:hypothetical protein